MSSQGLHRLQRRLGGTRIHDFKINPTHLSQFDGLSKYEIEKSKRDAQRPVPCLYKPTGELKPPFFFCIPPLPTSKILPIPIRPVWTKEMGKEVVEQNEINYFENYLQVMRKHGDDNLSFFEHNLLVWRQLWNCTEMSDVVLLFADIRFPTYHFPYHVYAQLSAVKKPCLLVLTKCDLVSEKCVEEWIEYFTTEYNELHVVPVASFKKEEADSNRAKPTKTTGKRYDPVGLEQLIAKIQEVLPHKQFYFSSRNDEDVKDTSQPSDVKETPTTDNQVKQKPVILGMVGQPNVGKSSLINALKGTKVVSVSATPGHTKWRQDIFINDSLMLCDCPGLVFPMLGVPRPLQVLIGLVPLASLQDPWSVLTYLMKYLPLRKILGLERKTPKDCDPLDVPIETDISPWDLATMFAEARGYKTHKNVPDAYRASKEIVTDVVEGRYMLYTLPKFPLEFILSDTEIEVNNEPQEQQSDESGDEDSEEQVDEGVDLKSSDEEDSDDDEEFAPVTSNPFALLNQS